MIFCITKLSKESKSPQDVVNLSDVINLVEIVPKAFKSVRLQMNNFIRVVSKMLSRCDKSLDVSPVVMKLLHFVVGGFDDFKITMTHSARTFRTLAEDMPGILAPHTSDLIDKVLNPEFVAQWDFCQYSQDIT